MPIASRQNRFSIETVMNSFLGSPWIWGTAATFIFYGVLPFSLLTPRDIHRYFHAHWTESASVCLFFVGVCALLEKFKRFRLERTAIREDFLGETSQDLNADLITQAEELELRANQINKGYRETLVIQRVKNLLKHVLEQQSSHDLKAYLQSLTEVEAARQSRGFGLVRMLVWMIPTLGIFGTITRISVGITNITPEKMNTAFSKVTHGLAVAFDPVTLAIGLSMILVFCKFFAERFVQQTLEEIHEFCSTRWLSRFPVGETIQESPLGMAEQQAAQNLLIASERMINLQMALWQKSLEELRDRWSNTLCKQQDSLEEMIQTGLTTALSHHSQQFVEARTEMLEAFQQTSESIRSQLEVTCSELKKERDIGSEQIAQTWQQFRTETTKTRDEHTRQLAILTQAITSEVGNWQNQLASSTQTINLQFHELRHQGEVFLKISENEAELVRLENRLAENLESVKVVESLENTLMSLNAAVNLLTSRVKFNAA